MAVIEKIEEVKSTLNKIKRDYRFKKANSEREKMAELQASMAKCRGQLELALKDFDHSIHSHVDYLKSERHSETDIALREKLIWDSAMGYLLVNEAINALKTVSSNESITYGYKVLEIAIDQMNGKKKRFPTRGNMTKERHVKYNYLNSEEMYEEKTRILECIFDSLKASGDIEACISAYENENYSSLGVSADNIDKTSKEYLDSLLNGNKSGSGGVDISIDDIDTEL